MTNREKAKQTEIAKMIGFVFVLGTILYFACSGTEEEPESKMPFCEREETVYNREAAEALLKREIVKEGEILSGTRSYYIERSSWESLKLEYKYNMFAYLEAHSRRTSPGKSVVYIRDSHNGKMLGKYGKGLGATIY